jgi:glucose/arabinose dehydrogenase
MRLTSIVALLALAAAAVQSQTGGQNQGVQTRPPNAPNQQPAFPGQTRAPERISKVAFDVVTVVPELQSPWGMTFLPDGRMLVTEKAGRLHIVGKDGTLSEPLAGVPTVDARGQGGLLDVALDPAYAKNQLVYLSFSEPQPDGTNNTAVARGRLLADGSPRLENVEVIYHQVPSLSSRGHFGSRLVFARDGTLFVTQGDRQNDDGRMHVQKLDNLIGAIARINPDGSIPKDNPFVGKDGARPEIWSYGHRNIQSAALHPETGELWEVEHGTRGGDELNIARKGLNYGWPTVAYGIEYRGGPIFEGITRKEGTEQPAYYWDPVIAPSGMLFYTGSAFPEWEGNLFVGGLATMRLVRLVLDGNRVVGEEHLLGDLQPMPQRIRDVRQGPDGAIYLLTNVQKGTGARMIKLVPKS